MKDETEAKKAPAKKKAVAKKAPAKKKAVAKKAPAKKKAVKEVTATTTEQIAGIEDSDMLQDPTKVRGSVEDLRRRGYAPATIERILESKKKEK